MSCCLWCFVWTGLRVLTLRKKLILWDLKRKGGTGKPFSQNWETLLWKLGNPSLSWILIPSSERSSPSLPWVTLVLSATLSCYLREGIQCRNQVIGVLRTYKWAHIGDLSCLVRSVLMFHNLRLRSNLLLILGYKKPFLDAVIKYIIYSIPFMQWVTSASLLFAWFPFRAKTVGIVKNTLLVNSHPQILAQCVKYESKNIHICSVLSQWACLDSSFNKIQVIPCDSTFATQHVLRLDALCFADATGEAWWRGACGWERDKTTFTVNKSITHRGSLNSVTFEVARTHGLDR